MFEFFNFGSKTRKVTLGDLETLRGMAEIVVQGVENKREGGSFLPSDTKKSLAVTMLKAAAQEADLPVPDIMVDAAIEAGVAKLFGKKKSKASGRK